MMNNRSGIDHIKSQLFYEGKLFSFEGRANRLQFFIITLFTLPIFILLFEYGLFVFMKAIVYSNVASSFFWMAMFFTLLLLVCGTSGYIFFATARRRLRDLNIAISPYIKFLILLNVFLPLLSILLFDILFGDSTMALRQLKDPALILAIGIIFIDIVVLLIMFSIKGVSNVNQE
ncbi:hypothetical protein [Mannheimia varigena]|uniref:hypothetical protein n=1 Tax=Mannheimia varigena TaxID=85404 RepID=UPI0012DE5585|nr:hypothetical protein [Mannheimia varigena]